MTKKTKRRIPKGYLYVDKDYGTRAIQDRYGKMLGRKSVRGRGDSTAVLRVKKGPRAGEIWGRTKPIVIKKHKRTSKKGRKHKVRKHRRR